MMIVNPPTNSQMLHKRSLDLLPKVDKHRPLPSPFSRPLPFPIRPIQFTYRSQKSHGTNAEQIIRPPYGIDTLQITQYLTNEASLVEPDHT